MRLATGRRRRSEFQRPKHAMSKEQRPGHDHPQQPGPHDHADEHAHAPSEVVLNPDAQAERETTLTIAGMDCAEEVAAIERALKPLSGVREVRTNLLAGKATISHDASLTADSLIKLIGAEGLKAAVAT